LKSLEYVIHFFFANRVLVKKAKDFFGEVFTLKVVTLANRKLARKVGETFCNQNYAMPNSFFFLISSSLKKE